MSQEACAAQPRHQPGRPPAVHRGCGRLCLSCFAWLRSSVARLPKLYRDCEEVLINPRSPGSERVRGGLPTGVCLNDAVVTARSEILTVAAGWARRLADERPDRIRPRRHIDELCRFFLANLRCLAAHPSVGDTLADLAQVTRQAEQAIDPGHGVIMPLGPCERADCDGTVHATLGARSTAIGVNCDRGHLWPPSQWLLLRHRLEQARRAPGGRPTREGGVAA